jgi:hypothetical protein
MADNTTALGKIASRRLRAVRWFVCAAAIGPACRRVATFKTELVDGRFPGYEHAEHEILHWIGFLQ